MEDRSEAGLWLEMSSLDPATYGASRATELERLAGVERVSWWSNVVPERTDLPRRLPEFPTLGLCEVGADFAPPDPPVGTRGLHFMRTGRPGQGRLTGRPTIGLSLVLIGPRQPGQAQALRDWADFVHIRHIAEAAVPGYSMITPYENRSGTDPLYLHLYEIDDEDPESVFQRMTPMVTERIGDPATEAWQDWARCPELRIFYVNTFRREGVHPAGGAGSGG